MRRSQEIYRKIRDEIVTGDLHPCERLIENDLGKKYGASRGLIRTAFHYLEKDGYINIVPNKGAIVAQIKVEEVKDYYALLTILECQAVEWSYPNLTETDLQALSDINRSMQYWTENSLRVDVMKWHEINTEFHGYFWSKSGNSKLSSVIKDIRKRLSRLRYWSIVAYTYDNYYKGHEEIIACLRRGDPERARAAMANHLVKACEIHVDLFSRI